ncbi:MAG: polysaccharide biosynthesis protein [Lachnospiraceae bacterium]|nr:polysaccharide biosynthesis protein [Lachnospiraceae bacterium]
MSDNRAGSGLVKQAGILMAAGVIVRIIGLLYNTPLVKVIGDEGNGYYNTAYAAYSIVLLISSYSIPSAISRVMAVKLAKKEYRNAHRVFQAALIYVVAVGIAASSFVFFGARILVRMESAVLPLRILAPTIFLSGILGVFRGFFQAQRTMVPTSVSQIIEQIFNAVFSVWMAYILVNSAAGKPSSTVASYGAAGSTIGTGVGVLSALLFMIGMYALNSRTIRRRIDEDTHASVDSFPQIFRTIFLVVTPFILSTGIYNVNTFLDNRIYQWLMMDNKKITEAAVSFDLSIVSKAVKIANIPIAMASAMASTLIPQLSSDIASEDRTGAEATIAKATKVTMFISIPSAVGIGVLSRPIMQLLFPQQESISSASVMLSVLSVTVALYGLSTITQAVLQSSGQMNLPIWNALSAVLLHTLFMIIFTMILPREASLWIYGISTIIYALTLCVLNGLSVRKYTGYRQELDRTFARPLISSLVMGGAAFGIYHGIHALLKSNAASLLIAVVFGIVIYFVLTVKWKAVEREDLLALPKGGFLVRAAEKLRLL